MVFDLSPDQAALEQDVAAFAARELAPSAAVVDEHGRFPRELVSRMAARGLMGVTIPKEWGGLGREYVSYALALEALAAASAVLAVIASVNVSLVAEPIAQFGSDAQKHAWLRRLATGDALGAFALSEEQGGSDAANLQSTARSEGRGYVLSGRKVWVANGEAADLAIVFAATPDSPASARSASPEPSEGRRRGIGAFLVPLDAPGVTRTPRDSLGVRGLGCVDLQLSDVRVDASALLGGPQDGFQIAMWALDGGRVAIAAQALGIGRAALDAAVAHAKQHVAFGQPISTYQAIQWMLADTAVELDAARMLTLKAADARSRRDRPTVEAAMAKLAASEAAHHAADRAMQILASQGYRRGSVVERLFRDVRAAEIYQGTSEVQRMVISDHLL